MYTNFLTSLLAASSSTIGTENIKAIEELAKLSTSYGFMMIFSIVILILVCVLFIRWSKISEKKEEEAIKERSHMHEMLFEVSTQQVIDLKALQVEIENGNKILLEAYNKSVENREKLSDINLTVHNIDDAVKDIDKKDDTILSTLSEVLTYVKTNESTNKEILDKVNKIDNFIKEIKEQEIKEQDIEEVPN